MKKTLNSQFCVALFHKISSPQKDMEVTFFHLYQLSTANEKCFLIKDFTCGLKGMAKELQQLSQKQTEVL